MLPTPDRDLEFLSTPATAEAPPHAPERYQRLVANPFLALTVLVAWAVALAQARALGLLARTWPLFFSLLGVPFLLQYHCLDCGATGRFQHWRRHACAAVRERWHAGRPRRLRGPSPPVQLLLWLYALLLAGIVWHTLGPMQRPLWPAPRHHSVPHSGVPTR